MNKADYVRRQPGDGHHTCHWPGCDKLVPPAMWGCRLHWYQLPINLRNDIWATYRPGQEITKNPSRPYMLVAKRIDMWIRAKGLL